MTFLLVRLFYASGNKKSSNKQTTNFFSPPTGAFHISRSPRHPCLETALLRMPIRGIFSSDGRVFQDPYPRSVSLAMNRWCSILTPWHWYGIIFIFTHLAPADWYQQVHSGRDSRGTRWHVWGHHDLMNHGWQAFYVNYARPTAWHTALSDFRISDHFELLS